MNTPTNDHGNHSDGLSVIFASRTSLDFVPHKGSEAHAPGHRVHLSLHSCHRFSSLSSFCAHVEFSLQTWNSGVTEVIALTGSALFLTTNRHLDVQEDELHKISSSDAD
jgi:hypothetical protein